MSKFKTQVKSVEILTGNICKVILHLERPDKDTGEIREVNVWPYVGTFDEWLSEDGRDLAPPEHEQMLNTAAKKYILQQRYKKFLQE